MGGLSVDGLISGLDTTSLIQQLLQIERQPQVQLVNKKNIVQKSISLLQELNTKFQSITDAAEALSTADAWASRTASSSDEAIATATAGSGAANGSYTFEVTSLAARHTTISANSVADLSTVVADGTDITIGATTITAADYGGGTLSEVVAAINAADAGVAAAAIQVSPGQYRLQLTADDSGSANVFTLGGTALDATLGSFGIVTQGSDAELTVGTGPAAYTVTSESNTFADSFDGLTIEAKSLGQVTVTVDTDSEAIADKAEALVSSMNEVITWIKNATKYDAEKDQASIFTGTHVVNVLRFDLVDSVISPVSGSTLVGSSVGISTDRYGDLTFDRAKFLDALAEDPDAVAQFFTENGVGTADDGIAARIELLSEEISKSTTGRIASMIEGRETQVRSLEDRIDSWDQRLELREALLRRQFAALETGLGQMQSRSQWLAGALASLPQVSSS